MPLSSYVLSFVLNGLAVALIVRICMKGHFIGLAATVVRLAVGIGFSLLSALAHLLQHLINPASTTMFAAYVASLAGLTVWMAVDAWRQIHPLARRFFFLLGGGTACSLGTIAAWFIFPGMDRISGGFAQAIVYAVQLVVLTTLLLLPMPSPDVRNMSAQKRAEHIRMIIQTLPDLSSTQLVWLRRHAESCGTTALPIRQKVESGQEYRQPRFSRSS